MSKPLSQDPRPLGRLDDGTVYYAPLGEIPYDADEDRVQCHLCGGWYRIIGGTHLRHTHGWTVDEYRERLGLVGVDATCSPGLSEALRRRAKRRIAAGEFVSSNRTRPASLPGRRTRYKDSLAALRPDLVAQLDPERNSAELDVTRIGVKSGRRLWWRCADCGHAWQAAPHNRSRGRGCPKCAYVRRAASKRRAPAERSLAQLHPGLAAEFHPTRNPGVDPSSLAPYSLQKVFWRCSTCGHEWQTAPQFRVGRGSGCPACATRAMAAKNGRVPADRSLLVRRPEIAAELDPGKNGESDASTIAAFSNKKLWWLCPSCGNSWEAAAHARGKAGRCPACRE
jgi:rubrerythrin